MKIKRSAKPVLVRLTSALLLAGLILPAALHAQSLLWGKKAAASGSVQSNAVAVDAAGNIYVTGSFQGTATFGAGEVNQTALISAGDQDVFVAKYSALGAFQWARRAGGSNLDTANGIIVDTAGNSFIAGSFESTATFGAGESNETSITSAGFQDIFLAKFNPVGALVWAKRAGGSESDVALAITLDATGNSYVTGRFAGSATFGPGESNQMVLTSAGSSSVDIFIAVFDGNGALLRARHDGGSGFDQGNSIAVDGAGNSYITGSFNGAAIFGAAELNQTTLNDSGNGDIFVAKYDSSGALAWAKAAGGSGITTDQGNAIAVDSLGNVYITGAFLAAATFGAGELKQTVLNSAGSSDAFIAKLNSSGALQWVKGVGGTSTDRGLAIDIDSLQNVYVTGSFRNTVIFGQGEANETTLTALGTSDAFHAKYRSDGSLLWAKRSGGAASIATGTGIAVDNFGHVYLTGVYSGTVTFGAGETDAQVFTSGNLLTDLFVAKYRVDQARAAENDFDGDGNSDILWRHSSGHVYLWLLDGNSVVGDGYAGSVSSDWTIADVGDFNGDGKADILWRHSLGNVYIWFLDGNSVIGSGPLGNVSTDWTIAGVGDFNGDGKADILWRHASGHLYIWLLDGTSVIGDGYTGTATLDWSIAGLGDFNGDGKSDVLWRHSSGNTYIWMLNGLSVVADGSVSTVDTDWSIAGVGDFNNDGKSDILWRHSSGNTYIWMLNGTSVVADGSVSTVSTDWSIVNVGDFNGDGTSDILWRHTSGAVYVWLLNGIAVVGDGPIGTASSDWEIQ